MANLNKVDVPVAVEHKSKLDLSFDHVTTMDFMSLQPVGYRHCIKKESLSMKALSIVRPAPIEVPTFGRLRQNLRAFFVPYRIVFPNWAEFYNDVIASNADFNSLVSSVPLLPNASIVNLFFEPRLGSTETDYAIQVASGQPYDFLLGLDGWRLKKKGRRVLKILESLGYKILVSQDKDDQVNYNALALLAYAKVYVDWYSNSQYLNSTDVLVLERLFKYNDPTFPLILTEVHLSHIFNLIGHVVYDNEDYYINAWDNPVSPNSGQYTAFGFADPTSNAGTYVTTNGLGSPEMIQNSGSSSIGTTYLHEALKKLTDFQKRHALAGARAIDRVLAQYGVVTDSLKQSRSVYVGSQSIDINIGSVMATADSSNGSTSSSTGDYAGAGYGQGEHSWDFIPDEEGIFIVMASIIPTSELVQGYDRNNMHINKFDFFVPEFDSLGVQAIERGEVYVSQDSAFAMDTQDYLGVFGFSGRYAEYKRPKSFLTGDIRLTSLQGMSSWHLFRLFDDVSFNGIVDNVVHSLDLTRGEDAEQYNRMFQYTEGDYDPFYCFIHFDFAVYAPCRPLFETYEFDSESKKVPTENGNKLN